LGEIAVDHFPDTWILAGRFGGEDRSWDTTLTHPRDE
jgi:hypothetical protein